MISKELLSVVLGIPLAHIRYNDTTNLYKIFKEDLFNWSDGSYGRWSNLEVNIYELAHKCKEWAVNLSPNKHALSSYARWGDIRNYKKTNGSYYICQHLVSGIQFEAESEPEAIFKACQWILTKDSK